ncbi:hypothetical protein [Paraflavitalea speifideaquila]|nr:hypothetical protein [Paraflavitalea speifideiaquila]
MIKQANDSGLLRGDFIVLPDYDLNKDSLAAYKNITAIIKAILK